MNESKPDDGARTQTDVIEVHGPYPQAIGHVTLAPGRWEITQSVRDSVAIVLVRRAEKAAQ